MSAYNACWLAGGVIGCIAGLLVLRYRGALSWRAPLAYTVGFFGCLYGAKVQYRLRFFPPAEALWITPEELLLPGLHIPLGLAAGFVAAMFAARLLRVPLFPMSDALAMTGAAMMPIGRIGCLVAGCCRGTVCPRWLDSICVRWSDLPSAHGSPEQLVHLLPVYFALLGLATVGLQLWLLRKRVAPGTLIVVTFLVHPLGNLAIEQLRSALGDRSGVMTKVLLTMIAADLVVIFVWLTLRRARRRLASYRGVTIARSLVFGLSKRSKLRSGYASTDAAG